MKRALFNWMIALAGVAGMELSPPLSLARSNQDASPPASQPAGNPPAAPPSSLDELLGIDKEKKGGQPADAGSDAAAQDNNEELKRKLNEAEVADAFEAAIQKMSLSAEMLDGRFDTGLGTQRVQEDIIAKLAQLIDQAKKQKSKSKSSSSSSRSSSSKQNDPGSQNQAQKQGQQQQNQGNQRNNKPADSREGEPPDLQQGDVNKVIDETRTEWGSLPPRVREMLLQGRRDKKSRLYEQLTNEYYKRLAEENAP